MKKPLTGIQANVLKLYETDPSCVNEDALLVSRYWYAYDKWETLQGNLHEKLKAVTSWDSITRARRYLHEHEYIEYSAEVDKIREIKYKEALDEYGQKVMIQI